MSALAPPSALRRTLRAYAELTRPPALCTAPADAVTGLTLTLLWSGASPLSLTPELLPAALASVCLYAAGMTTNDLFDARLDAHERPERPLPSGRASARGALALALTLQALALALAASRAREAGSSAPLIAVGLTCLATYLYNALLKSTPLGPLSMAACRAGSLWVGIAWGAPALDLGAGALTQALSFTCVTTLYITALTALARHEVHGGEGARPLAQLLALMTLAPAALALRGALSAPAHLYTLSGALTLALSAALSAALARALLPHLRATLHATTPAARAAATRQMVGAGVRGVALLNASLCATLGAALSVALLLALSWCARRVGRWFYAT